MREELGEGRHAENSRKGRKIMMRNKRRSGGSDKRLRGVNVKSGSKRTQGGGGGGGGKGVSEGKHIQIDPMRERAEQIGTASNESKLLASFCCSG